MPGMYCSLEGLLYSPPPPACLDVPAFAAWNCDCHVNSGIFHVPRLYDMGMMGLLPLQREACWGFFRPEKSWWLWPGLNLRTWILKGSTLPLDHWSHYVSLLDYGQWIFQAERQKQASSAMTMMVNWQTKQKYPALSPLHSWHIHQLQKVLHSQTTVRWPTQNFTAAGLWRHVMAQVVGQWCFAVDA
jgi:hypothetical protein